jgi:predicted transcriptional regulator
MDEETLKLFAFIKVSPFRLKVLKTLENESKTPTQISKDVGTRVFYVSRILRELKDRDIVKCINEDKRKFRFYQLTDRGQELLEYLK